MQSRQKAHEDYRALTTAMEDALGKWALRMDPQGFPPRLDIFKATVKKAVPTAIELQEQLNRNPWAQPD